jgi:hypothetical protein
LFVAFHDEIKGIQVAEFRALDPEVLVGNGDLSTRFSLDLYRDRHIFLADVVLHV